MPPILHSTMALFFFLISVLYKMCAKALGILLKIRNTYPNELSVALQCFLGVSIRGATLANHTRNFISWRMISPWLNQNVLPSLLTFFLPHTWCQMTFDPFQKLNSHCKDENWLQSKLFKIFLRLEWSSNGSLTGLHTQPLRVTSLNMVAFIWFVFKTVKLLVES